MSRFPVVFEWLGLELYDVAIAMLDGSYYQSPKPWEHGEHVIDEGCADGGEG